MTCRMYHCELQNCHGGHWCCQTALTYGCDSTDVALRESVEEVRRSRLPRAERESLALRAFGLDRTTMRTESVTSRATCDADVVTEDTCKSATPRHAALGTPGATLPNVDGNEDPDRG